jgi:hypothetical protein
MAAMAHVHNWTGVPGGYQCTGTPGCTAFTPDSEVRTNLPFTGTTRHNLSVGHDQNQMIQLAFKAAGH